MISMLKIFILVVNPITIILLIVIYIILLLTYRNTKSTLTRKLFKNKLEKLEYNRDFIKDILLYYGIIENLLGIQTNFIGFLLLGFVEKKWILYQKNYKDEYEYKIGEKPYFKDNEVYEKELYDTILYVAGKDYVLEKNELLDYVKKPIGQLRLYYIKSMIKGESYNFLWDNKFVVHNKVNETIKKEFDLHNYYAYSFGDKGKSVAAEIYGLYRYIRDFTLLREKGIEVESYWNELFRYAVLFNLSEKIKEMINQNKVDYLYNNVYENMIFGHLDTVECKNKTIKTLDGLVEEYDRQKIITKELFDKKFVIDDKTN